VATEVSRGYCMYVRHVCRLLKLQAQDISYIRFKRMTKTLKCI